MDTSRLCGFTPRPTDSAPCGSKSTSRTRRPYSASAAPRLIVLVVLPTPPFWFAIAMIRAGPCRSSGIGCGIGRRCVNAVGSAGPSSAPRSNADCCSARICEVQDSAWCWMPTSSSRPSRAAGCSPPLADPAATARGCALPDCSPHNGSDPVDGSACCALTCVNQRAAGDRFPDLRDRGPRRVACPATARYGAHVSEVMPRVVPTAERTDNTIPLRALVAQNLRRLREDAGAGLDGVVRAAWGDGLDWTTAWLGGVERGTKSLTAEHLLAGEAPVSLGVDGRASVPARYLRDIVTGEPVRQPFATPRVAPHPEIDVAARAAEKLREIRRGGLGDVDIRALGRAEAGAGEAETRLARRLGIAPIRVIAAAASLWGRSLTEERDARLADGAGPPAVVARRLTAELTARIDEAARRAPPD